MLWGYVYEIGTIALTKVNSTRLLAFPYLTKRLALLRARAHSPLTVADPCRDINTML